MTGLEFAAALPIPISRSALDLKFDALTNTTGFRASSGSSFAGVPMLKISHSDPAMGRNGYTPHHRPSDSGMLRDLNSWIALSSFPRDRGDA